MKNRILALLRNKLRFGERCSFHLTLTSPYMPPGKKVSLHMALISNLWIIDDDPMASFYIKRLAELGELARIISIFDRAKGAAEYLLHHKRTSEHLPDCILLDLYMPELDGWGFLKQFEVIKDHLAKKVEVCIISSSGHSRDKERADRLPFVKAYLQKPITMEALRQVLEYNTVPHFENPPDPVS